MPVKHLQSRVMDDLVQDCQETIFKEAQEQIMNNVPQEHVTRSMITTNIMGLTMQFTSTLTNDILSGIKHNIERLEKEYNV